MTTVNITTLSKRFSQARDVPDQIIRAAFRHFRAVTPIRSGRARRSTRLQGDTIIADYPYAGPLDSGYSSQAPQGMTVPTVRFVQRLWQQHIKKLNRITNG